MLRIVRRGGKASTEPLSPIVMRALEDYVADRTTGPLFLNARGSERLSYSITYKLIRRLARRAGIPAADKISPHSLRHSFASELLGAGAPLQDVQDAMGHADPRTTRAYDRSRHNLDRHPRYAMAAHLRRIPSELTSSKHHEPPTVAARSTRTPAPARRGPAGEPLTSKCPGYPHRRRPAAASSPPGGLRPPQNARFCAVRALAPRFACRSPRPVPRCSVPPVTKHPGVRPLPQCRPDRA